MVATYSIKNIYKVGNPYVLAYTGPFLFLKEKLENERKLHENAHIEYFEAVNMKTCDDYIEAFIRQMHFDKYIQGGCGRNYNALSDCIEYLNEPYEIVGLNYNKFIIVIKDCEFLYEKEKDEIEGEIDGVVYKNYAEYLLSQDGDIDLFNRAGENLIEEIKDAYEDGTPYYRPPIPFHVIYHTTKSDVQFIQDLPKLLLN